ncbi:Rv0909 family putative TA system antitoxin [Homoserinimonas sp. OAct 916]|uniref:Rv0909 family putative TA system antitoxin n=1 Tax=Homoserinimonas sp. OAct 916 TaxID=2211450 RepID=UPI000DBE09C2|nr:Rv0909 family putative TA system antitoxin [Homoserinimonas sp. OAct 916]
MGIEDISKKAQDLLNDSKVQDALKSDQAEQISDNALDGASGLANKLTGNKFADQVEGVRSEADKKVGTE